MRGRSVAIAIASLAIASAAAFAFACSSFEGEAADPDGGGAEGSAPDTGAGVEAGTDGTTSAGVVDSDDFETARGLCGTDWEAETASAASEPAIGRDAGGGCRVCRTSENYFKLFRKRFRVKAGERYYARVHVRGEPADGGPMPSAELFLSERLDDGKNHFEQDDRVASATFELRQVNLTTDANNDLGAGLSFYSTIPGTCVVVDELRVEKQP